MEALTEEQREELLSEIQALVSSKFEEWGIEPPEPLLTEEQHEQLKNLITEMREAEATPEEVKEAVKELLEEFGVELPPRGELPPGKFAGRGGFKCRCRMQKPREEQ
jgi:hypothetical protein